MDFFLFFGVAFGFDHQIHHHQITFLGTAFVKKNGFQTTFSKLEVLVEKKKHMKHI